MALDHPQEAEAVPNHLGERYRHDGEEVKRCDFYSKDRAEAITPHPDVCMISLNDVYGPVAMIGRGWRDLLTLRFNDTYHGDCCSDLRRGSNPELHHAQEIVTFIRRNADCATILVHCHAGQCRSAAVALLLDVLGWKLADRRRAHAANPRLVCLLSEAADVVIALPHEAVRAQPEAAPTLWW
jgi:predicted protein tyrosine phosphatase